MTYGREGWFWVTHHFRVASIKLRKVDWQEREVAGHSVTPVMTKREMSAGVELTPVQLCYPHVQCILPSQVN